MTDDQMNALLGVDETMQMLRVREQMKIQMGPELYAQNMNTHKATIQVILDKVPGISPLDASEFIVDQLDADTTLDPDEREMWKAIIVIAAFEMQEF